MDESNKITVKNKSYYIEVDCTSAIAVDTSGKHIGHVGFNYQEGDYTKGQMDHVALYDANVKEDWRRHRVAYNCVLAINDYFGEITMSAPSRTDITSINGNSLSADGMRFVAYLREKKLILPDPADMKPSEDEW